MVYVNRCWDHGYKDAFGLEFIDWAAGAEPLRKGRSCDCSVVRPRRPLACSGLGVAVPPPLNEFIELLTLLDGVEDCCTALFSLLLPFALWIDDCDPATTLEPSFMAWAWVLSACFLLLKRNAIVPCAAGSHQLCYPSGPQTLRKVASQSAFDCFVWVESSRMTGRRETSFGRVGEGL